MGQKQELYVKFKINDASKYADFEKMYAHMVDTRRPGFEFKEEAYNLFQNRNIIIRHLLIRDFLHSFIL
mgnify:CR=1 FL=1